MVPKAPQAPPPRPELARHVSQHSKTSLPDESQSNEADDEQSLSEPLSTMDDHLPEPAFEGEDTRLTSNKELSGFYMYGWAAEVFVVCGIGSFIPITLEQLARENGVLLYDRKTPCKTSLRLDPPLGLLSAAKPKPDSGQCVVYILGAEINTASFAMYTFSISVAIQALLIISMSGAADHGRFRKTLLLWFAFIGSVSTMLFLPVVPKVYVLGAFFAIIANTCFGASFVLLNSFLPLLVRHHPTVQYAEDSTSSSSYLDQDPDLADSTASLAREAQYSNELSNEETVLDSVVDSTNRLLPESISTADLTVPNPTSPATPSLELALSTKISSYGIAIGYIGALILQTISIFIVHLTSSSTFGLRLVLFVVGAWWFVFTLPSAMWLRPRPGPPLNIPASASALRTGLGYFNYSWKSLGRTVKHARLLKDLLLFLAAWFLLSDSIATVSGTAVLFAKTTLRMEPAALALINVIATISGIVGAFTWSRISIYARLSPSQTILACIALFLTIPIYGLLGYIPAIQRYGSFGLQQAWEMYPLGAVYGFVLGGLSSYCRALYGELIPPGFEAQFYALYAITDKGSSIFGPAVVGAITDRWGEIRPAFWFLAVLIGLPFPIMWLVDVDRGREEALALAQALDNADKDNDDDRGRPDEEREQLRFDGAEDEEEYEEYRDDPEEP